MSEPPSDWRETDYRAAGFEDETAKPELSDRFYVAASTDECVTAHADQKTEFGKLVREPDLYLRFASARPTPSLILDFANRYRLLRYQNSHFSVRKSTATELLPTFDSHVVGLKPHPEFLFLTGEKALDWLEAFEGVHLRLRTWAEFQARRDLAGMSSFLEDGYNYAMAGSLTYQVKMDEQTERLRSEIIASSLAHVLDVQWGMSVAANVMHRQCAECPAWFSVHPGSGRPEKQFCSDACRMRAYRKRKAANKPGNTTVS